MKDPPSRGPTGESRHEQLAVSNGRHLGAVTDSERLNTHGSSSKVEPERTRNNKRDFMTIALEILGYRQQGREIAA
jgi:hypothetical protein